MKRAGASITIAVIGLASCGHSPSGQTGSPATTAKASVSPPSSNSVPPASSIVYGIDVNQFDSDIGPARVPEVLTMISRAGATAVRIGASWSSTEPSPGSFDWKGVDSLLNLAQADKLTVLFELGNEPAWDATGGNPAAPPADCDSPTASCISVSQYVTALVAHGAPEGLRYLIVRNEPQNYDKNWVGGDAATYAHFQQVVYQAAHRQDSAITVLNGGTEATSPTLAALRDSLSPQTPYEQRAAAFASALYADPTWCDSLDVLDVHVGDHGPVYSPQIVDSSELALMQCNGGRHVPCWVTEVGYPSTVSLQSAPIYQIELGGKYEGGEEAQASFLSDTFTALAHDANVIGIDWTFMIDPNISANPPAGASYNQTFSEGFGVGLADSTYKTKAAYQAFRQAASGR